MPRNTLTRPRLRGKRKRANAVRRSRASLIRGYAEAIQLVAINADLGKEVTNLPVADSVDDLAYDAAHHRLYAPGGGGEGSISVIQQRASDNYEVTANIATKPGAKTGKLVPELNRFYVGVPTKEKQEAQILVFEVAP